MIQKRENVNIQLTKRKKNDFHNLNRNRFFFLSILRLIKLRNDEKLLWDASWLKGMRKFFQLNMLQAYPVDDVVDSKHFAMLDVQRRMRKSVRLFVYQFKWVLGVEFFSIYPNNGSEVRPPFHWSYHFNMHWNAYHERFGLTAPLALQVLFLPIHSLCLCHLFS